MLKDMIERDIRTVFMQTADFCDLLSVVIGGRRIEIIGSLQSHSVQNKSGNTAPLQATAYDLYTAWPLADGLTVSTGERIAIDDVVYTVSGIGNEMGLARISLNKGGVR